MRLLHRWQVLSLPAVPAARVLGVGLTCVSSHQAEFGIVGEGRCDE